MSAIPYIQKQYYELQVSPVDGFSVELTDNTYEWIVYFEGPVDTYYFPGYYKGVLTFPSEFPFLPPKFSINSKFWHPNVYKDGTVCISILHNPNGSDFNPEEPPTLRWSPVQSIDKVLLSIISLLGDIDPTDSGAPANVDALSQYRTNKIAFIEQCKLNAKLSLKNREQTQKNDIAIGKRARIGPSVVNRDDMQNTLSGYSSTESKHHSKYTEELAQIRMMGVAPTTNDMHILKLLFHYKGDISIVIDELCK